jgi:hypothetical protein
MSETEPGNKYFSLSSAGDIYYQIDLQFEN